MSRCPPHAAEYSAAPGRLTRSYHLVKVLVTNDADTANDVTGSTGSVLFAINLQPAPATSSTNLCLEWHCRLPALYLR